MFVKQEPEETEMAKSEMDMYVKRLTPDHVLTVTVHVTRRFKVRFFIASLLLHAAGWVLGCGIEITDSNAEKEE